MTTGEGVLEPARATPEADARPYPASWVNVLTAWIDRLPGPSWAAYVVLVALSVAFTQVTVWATGVVPAGQIDAAQVYYGVVLPATLWLIHHLDGVARSALDAFRPALEGSDGDIGRWRYELTVVPRRPAAIIGIVSLLTTVGGYAADPVGTKVIGYSVPALALRAVFESTIFALVLVLLYHTVRQLGLVSRIHARAPRVDLFQPGPLYAFSRLTSRTAIGLVILQTPGVLFAGSTEFTVAFTAGWVGAIAVIGAAAFVLPLTGMHRRIADEKHRLEAAVGRRLEQTMADIHASVDERARGEADALNKTLTSLIAERDLVSRFPTWPWAAGTFWAFASAIVLPIALWFVTRLLENIV